MRWSLLAVAVLLSGSVCAQDLPAHDPDSTKLSIGVRSKARPFAYKPAGGFVETDAARGPLSQNGYGGYIARICDAVLAEMLIAKHGEPELSMDMIEIYDIDEEYQKSINLISENAKDKKDNRPPGTDDGVQIDISNDDNVEENASPVAPPYPSDVRFRELGEKYDILCDPATITNAHRALMVSPPLFLTGIGYLRLKDTPIPSKACGKSRSTQTGSDSGDGTEKAESSKSIPGPALVGLVGGTTAATRGLQALIAAKELPNFEDKLVQYLRLPIGGDRSAGASEENSGESVCPDDQSLVNVYPDHEEASRAFCRGDTFHYYLGDIDIIRTYASAISGCKFDSSPTTYTNDRYGIFGRAIKPSTPAGQSDVPGLQLEDRQRSRELLVARFFQILYQKVIFNPSVLDKAYDDTFPGQPQSQKLKLFYWAMRGERAPEPPMPLYTGLKGKSAN